MASVEDEQNNIHGKPTIRRRPSEGGIEFTTFQDGGRPKKSRFTAKRINGLKRAIPGKMVYTKRMTDMGRIKSNCFSVAINTRWVLWSNFLFFLGNLFYIFLAIVDIRCEDVDDDDENERLRRLQTVSTNVSLEFDSFLLKFCFSPTLYAVLNVTAAILFIGNPIADFMGTWAENKVTEIHEKLQHVQSDADPRDRSISTGSNGRDFDSISAIRPGCTDLEDINWDKHVAIIFLVGSLMYLWQAGLDWKNPDVAYYFALDVVASHTMLVDSIVAQIGWFVATKMNRGTSRERWLFACRPSQIDWSGWGDWLFLFGSILDAAVSYLNNYPYAQNNLNLLSSLLWLVDSIFYIIGYIFGQDIRRRFGNNYYSSLTHVEEESDEEVEGGEEDATNGKYGNGATIKFDDAFQNVEGLSTIDIERKSPSGSIDLDDTSSFTSIDLS